MNVASTLRLLAAAALIALPAAAQLPRAAAGMEENYRPVLTEAAPGIHLLHQTERPFQPAVIGNVTIVERASGVLLVDSGGNRSDGEDVVAAVRAITPKPVTHVVITHWHNDHPLGLSAIRAAWPNAEIVASAQTKAHMEAGRMGAIETAPSADYDSGQLKRLGDQAVDYESKAAAAGISAEEKRGWSALATVARQLAPRSRGSFMVMPTRTFSDRLELADASAPAEMVQLGRSNTDGDVMVWLPRQRVLIAGDAVVSPIPFGFSVFPGEWIEVLKKVRAYDFALLIPGHGAPQRDKAYLDLLIASMSDIRTQAAALAAKGVSDEEAMAQGQWEMQRRAFAGRDTWSRIWFDGYWLTPFLASAMKEAKGETLGPPPVAAR